MWKRCCSWTHGWAWGEDRACTHVVIKIILLTHVGTWMVDQRHEQLALPQQRQMQTICQVYSIISILYSWFISWIGTTSWWDSNYCWWKGNIKISPSLKLSTILHVPKLIFFLFFCWKAKYSYTHTISTTAKDWSLVVSVERRCLTNWPTNGLAACSKHTFWIYCSF